MRTTRITLAITGLATALALTACGQSTAPTAQSGSVPSPSGPASATVAAAHNGADTTFAQDMIVHHQQAIAMADLAPTRAGNAQVKDLAATIKAAQTPEITTMTGWLSAWGEPATAPTMSSSSDMGGMGGMGGMPGMGSMPGVMSSQEMTALGNLTGAAFDRQFLTMMVTHHQGAVDMARAEQAQGTNPDAKALAGKIITDQTAQIARMQQLLTQL